MAGTPPGFDAASVRAGLHQAMQFGISEAEIPTFVMPAPDPVTGDDRGVPWDIDAAVSRPARQEIQVLCALEYQPQVTATQGDLADRQPARITITILDEEYEQIKGFDYLKIGGRKFTYKSTYPSLGLGTVVVWQIRCESVDVG